MQFGFHCYFFLFFFFFFFRCSVFGSSIIARQSVPLDFALLGSFAQSLSNLQASHKTQDEEKDSLHVT